MLVPPFLLIDDRPDEAESFTALLRRIGLVNPVRIAGTVSSAQRFISGCAVERLPVIVFLSGALAEGDPLDLVEWMKTQQPEVASIGTIAVIDAADETLRERAAGLSVTIVDAPVEMRPLIAAMKALALPERARIDSATLTVQVELWSPFNEPPDQPN